MLVAGRADGRVAWWVQVAGWMAGWVAGWPGGWPGGRVGGRVVWWANHTKTKGNATCKKENIKKKMKIKKKSGFVPWSSPLILHPLSEERFTAAVHKYVVHNFAKLKTAKRSN